jgi:hypothetical protein
MWCPAIVKIPNRIAKLRVRNYSFSSHLLAEDTPAGCGLNRSQEPTAHNTPAIQNIKRETEVYLRLCIALCIIH